MAPRTAAGSVMSPAMSPLRSGRRWVGARQKACRGGLRRPLPRAYILCRVGLGDWTAGPRVAVYRAVTVATRVDTSPVGAVAALGQREEIGGVPVQALVEVLGNPFT